MLNHTKKIKDIYEEIQKELFYMIPEKWDKLYLYSCVIDMPKNVKTGELFFYYIPKGVLKKKPVNVYEIPNKFNLDENQYLKLVELLFNKIKQLREEFRKVDTEAWSNITLIIENSRVRVEYDYEDLKKSNFTSYERHIIWRFKYLGIGPEQVSKKDKEILKRFVLGAKTLTRKEIYQFGIYVKDVGNIIDYNTEDSETDKNVEYIVSKEERKNKNQILLSQEGIRKMKNNQENK